MTSTETLAPPCPKRTSYMYLLWSTFDSNLTVPNFPFTIHTMRRIPIFTSLTRGLKTMRTAEMDPIFNYTSGRWLWNEEAQLAARSISFNVEALKQTACRALHAESCTSLEKIGEGGFNKALRLTMDDGRTIIAKLPHPNAGPAKLTTSSEAATMEYARSVLKLPVPKVLGWSDTKENVVESEYILMEEAKGSQLSSVWHGLPLEQKVHVIRGIVDVQAQMMSTPFDM